MGQKLTSLFYHSSAGDKRKEPLPAPSDAKAAALPPPPRKKQRRAFDEDQEAAAAAALRVSSYSNEELLFFAPTPDELNEINKSSSSNKAQRDRLVQWYDRVNLLVKYKQEYGNCDVPQTNPEVHAKYPKLSLFVSNMRKYKKQLEDGKKVPLTPRKMDVLNQLNFNWGKRLKKQRVSWETRFLQLQQLYKDNGHCNIPLDCQDEKNRKEFLALWQWCENQRCQYKAWIKDNKKTTPPMSTTRESKLNSIGFVWDNNTKKKKQQSKKNSKSSSSTTTTSIGTSQADEKEKAATSTSPAPAPAAIVGDEEKKQEKEAVQKATGHDDEVVDEEESVSHHKKQPDNKKAADSTCKAAASVDAASTDLQAKGGAPVASASSRSSKNLCATAALQTPSSSSTSGWASSGSNYIKRSVSNSKYSHLKVKARMNASDGTVAPASVPKKGSDGLYLRPPGRSRDGMDWDPVRGVWSPTKKGTDDYTRPAEVGGMIWDPTRGIWVPSMPLSLLSGMMMAPTTTTTTKPAPASSTSTCLPSGEEKKEENDTVVDTTAAYLADLATAAAVAKNHRKNATNNNDDPVAITTTTASSSSSKKEEPMIV